MNYSNYRISLDIHDTSSQVSLSVKKGDTNRKIYAVLTESGKPYTLSPECTAMFTARKPDKNIVYNACTIDGNSIVYVMTPQTTAAVGVAECELKLYGSDNALITSPRFTIIIEDAVYSDGDPVESATEVTALTKLISETAAVNEEARRIVEDADALEESVKAAEKSAAEAEGYTSHPPVIGGNGTWMQWDGTAYVDTGLPSCGEDGPQGDSGLPDVKYERPLYDYLVPNVEYRLGTINELVINGFIWESNDKAGIWVVQFNAGDTISVTVPSDVIWYAAQPVFTPGNTYMLTFLMMENYQYICVWVEVTP